MKKIITAVLGSFGALLTPLVPVHAMCPICTVAIIGGIGILERYGVDDVLAGLWIGALIVSMTLWTINWLEKRHWSFPFYKPANWIFYLAIVLIPLYTQGFMFSPLRHSYFLGIDRLFTGIVVGGVVFWAAGAAYVRRKAKHGKALYPFQKVIQPVGAVVAATIVFYFITLSY